MVSDFIDERNGYLQLTDEEYTRAKVKDPTIRKMCIRNLSMESQTWGTSQDGRSFVIN